MAIKQEYEIAYVSFVFFGLMTLLANIYYFTFPMWDSLGWSNPAVTSVFLLFKEAGFFDSTIPSKGVALLLSTLTVMTRHGRKNELKGWILAVLAVFSLALYFTPFGNFFVYIGASLLGYALCVTSAALILYKFAGYDGRELNDINETFEQCTDLVPTKYSVNLETKFQYKKKMHRGYINVVNPFRGTLILGTPGSGKSFSIYNQFIEQMICKGYTMFVYDFKFPSLTEDVYNIWMECKENGVYEKLKMKEPTFHMINFKDARYSNRCNPLNAKYIKSLTEVTELAEVIMNNLAKNEKKDFWSQSGQLYVDCGLSLLWLYQKGRYCSFPHLVEFLSQPVEKVLEVIKQHPELQTKAASFIEALDKKATETIAGQTTSATVPIAGLSSPPLYWVMSGDDVTLDISKKDAPKIVCVGNDPANRNVYGTALALDFARLFKEINVPGNLPSAVLLDEAPTVIIKDLDQLINTARSNLVATVLGGQDKSQFIRDYGDKYANVIFNAVGNIISGQVNSTTAEAFSKMFGKEFREKRSQTLSDHDQSMNVSFNLEELLPASRIETLSQGTFFGKIADDFGAKINHKLFCGEVVVDFEKAKQRKKHWKPLPRTGMFDEKNEKEFRDVKMKRYGEKALLDEAVMKKLKAEHPNAIFNHEDVDLELADMSEKDKKALLDKYLENLYLEYIEYEIKENYNSIKNDIRCLMEDHGLSYLSRSSEEEFDEEAADKEKEFAEFVAGSRTSDGVEDMKPEEVSPIDE